MYNIHRKANAALPGRRLVEGAAHPCHPVGQTVSEIVRRALREKYAGAGSRGDAMQAFVGIRKGRRDLPDTDAYVRQLRKGERIERLKA
jgi:hypothetical protein